MVWKSDGQVQKSPSSFSLDIEDIDVDSFRSPVTASLVDRVLAKGLVKASFSFSLCSEEEAEALMAETWKNPMKLQIKCPILGGNMLEADFRCSKRKCEMIDTNDETGKTRWKISFSVSQKKKVRGQ